MLERLKINKEGELVLQTIITHWRAFGQQQILENFSGSMKNLVNMANHMKRMEVSGTGTVTCRLSRLPITLSSHVITFILKENQ